LSWAKTLAYCVNSLAFGVLALPIAVQRSRPEKGIKLPFFGRSFCYVRRQVIESHIEMPFPGPTDYLVNFCAIVATRFPSAAQSTASSSLIGLLPFAPARWLAPYGVPPVVVVLSAASE
jgi:hypothetical protein